MFEPIEQKPEKPKRRMTRTTRYHKDIGKLAESYAGIPDKTLRTRRARTSGRRTKLGLFEFLRQIFEHNEKAPRKSKLTNAAIARAAIDEYPNQQSLHRGLQSGKGSINYYRNLYNTGRLTGDSFPVYFSFRYDEEGFAVDTRTGKKRLTQEQRIATINEYRRRFQRRTGIKLTMEETNESQ